MTLVLHRASDQQTQFVVLSGITWQTYQALLKDLGNQRALRLAYDQGFLEIIMPSDLHDFISRLLEALIRALTEELGLPLRGYGSTTLDRSDLERGVEPDSCFYIQHVQQVLGKSRPGKPETRLDLITDPPPDLAVEVDIASSSYRRFGIYQQLRIPEVWRYTEQDGLVIYQLQAEQYVECEFSPTFPMVSGAALMPFLKMAETTDDNSVIRALRQWICTRSTASPEDNS